MESRKTFHSFNNTLETAPSGFISTGTPFPTVSFLGISMHAVTMGNVLDWMEKIIQGKHPHLFCTMNAALLVQAQKDPFLKKTYREAHLVTCDSTVVYYALKCLGKKVPEPLEACQIMCEFIKNKHQKGYRIYLLGAKPEMLEKAVQNLKNQYPNIQIVGYHHGYFSPIEEEKIVQQITKTKPDCLFVGMSTPQKERFLTKYLNTMRIPICLGVGGVIDVLAGELKFAPKWLCKLGLAWFYRLCLEPRRMWKRYLITNTVFLWLFLKELFRHNVEAKMKGNI